MITTTALLQHKYDSPSGNVSYVLFQPEQTFTFIEGQFCMIEAVIDGVIIKKPYSIASTNKQLQEEKLIWFVVKKASENGMSHYLTQAIKNNDHITLKWPVWHYINPQKHKNYLFVSVWSGLSPNFWVFQNLINEPHTYEQIIHLYGERNSSELVPMIEEYAQGVENENTKTFFCLSQETSTKSNYLNCRVQEQLPNAIATLWMQTTCFICGSPAAVNDITEKLLALWISREDIISEKY